MSTPLLATKLYVPTVRPDLVARRRLIERLDEGLQRRLTLVSAPAGFGKTTLVSAWAAGCARPLAWLSLDEGDNDPARFAAYLAGAVRTVGVEIEGDVPADVSTPAAAEPFLTALINRAAAAPDPLILVLDDYHLITAQPVHDALAFLLDHLPDSLHLVIATRADPPLPLARLRGLGQLTELRLSDLRFSPQEAAEFLQRAMGLSLSADDVAALSSRTEGWIAGLQMAALSLQGKEDVSHFIAAFTGSNRYILDYLLEEVLRREADQVQLFLLQTSVLDRFCAPLCDAVIGDSQPESPADARSVLEHLEASNLFILPLDSQRRWYRYHRLFSDLLRQRLQQMHPHLVPGLHHRASEWLERNDLAGEAIDHALEAEDLERAAGLIEAQAETTLMRGEIATFMHWIGALPDALLRARPGLCVLYAWMLLWQGQSLTLIESLVQEAEQRDESVSARVTALRGVLAGLRGQTELAIELSSRALEKLPPEDRFVRTFATWILRVGQRASGDSSVDDRILDDVLRSSQRTGNVMLSVMILCNQAELLMRQGQRREAAATYRKALQLGTDAKGQRIPIAGQALIGLGELARESGDLDSAESYLAEGIDLAEQWTEVGPLEAYISLARVRWAQGDQDRSWDALRKAQELAVKFDLTELDDLSVAMFQAWFWVVQGDLEPVQRWAEERELYQYVDTPLHEEAGDSVTHRMRKYELLVLARLLTAQGRSAQALKLLESLVPIAEWRGRPGMLIEIRALQGLALQAQGDLEGALAAVERALALAEPEEYVRVFADEGEPMADLLREAAKRSVAPDYVSRLLASFAPQEPEEPERPPAPAPPTAALVEPLTERELQVLRLLNTHLSSTEIAERLCISVNTVRFHVKNVYQKLNVHRRSDAVQRAGELGLL